MTNQVIIGGRDEDIPKDIGGWHDPTVLRSWCNIYLASGKIIFLVLSVIKFIRLDSSRFMAGSKDAHGVS